MKNKISYLVILVFASLIGHSQHIDSVIVNLGNPNIVFIKGTMPQLVIDKIEFFPLNDANNTQLINIHFKGCPLNQIVLPFDTSIVFDSPFPFDMRINTFHDTSSICPYPTEPILMDSKHFSASQITDIVEVELLKKQIKVFPNPTEGTLTIENGELTIDNIEIYDATGKSVLRLYEQSEAIQTINISHLPNGIYLIKIRTEAGEFVQKVHKN